MTTPEPIRRDRPVLPEGYVPAEIAGSDAGLLAWAEVEQRLVDARHYWMATVRPDGRPHCVPRWGAWLENRLWYDGSPATVHATNLRANPACTLTIGDGAEAVIVEGRAAPSEPLDAEAGAPIAAEIARKYGADGYTPEAGAWSGEHAGGLVVFTPVKAMAWYDFPNDLTRFHFTDRR